MYGLIWGCETVVIEAERMFLKDFPILQESRGYSFGGYVSYRSAASMAKFDVQGVYGTGLVEIRYKAVEDVSMDFYINAYQFVLNFTASDEWTLLHFEIPFYPDHEFRNRIWFYPSQDLGDDVGIGPEIDRIEIHEACYESNMTCKFRFEDHVGIF